MSEYLMKIDYDPEFDEFYLKFIDESDRKKKSRFLKKVFENNISSVTMNISYKNDKPTLKQEGLYKAFQYLLKDFTGHELSEVQSLIYKNTDTSKEEIENYDKLQYSEFIEKLFRMCSEEIGIEVQIIDEKLQIIPEKND